MTDAVSSEPPADAPDTLVFSYLTSPNRDRYRRIMQCLLHRRSFRLRLSAPRISALLAELFDEHPTDSELEADLVALHKWAAIERQQDTSAAASTADFKRKRYTYDITAAGEIAERAALALDRSQRRVGALERSRLLAIRDDVLALAAQCGDDPDASVLLTTLEAVHAKLEAMRDSATEFMRDLGQIMGYEEALTDEAFGAYKNKVVDHLRSFKAAQTRVDADVKQALGRIEAFGVQRMLDLAAGAETPPKYGLDARQVRERRAAALAEQYEQLRYWFVGTDHEAPPWRELDRSLSDAIAWIIATAQRLIDRRARRVDRSAEYRHLARLFADAPDEQACHALHTVVFGLYEPRHLSVKEDDPQLTAATQSWWDGAAAPVETHLRRPASRDPGAGRTAQIRDLSAARERLRERRRRERLQLDAARARFAGRGPLRVSDFGELAVGEFAHLLGWLGRATEARRGADGRKVSDSADGTVRITLTLPDGAQPGRTLQPTVELRTAAGVLRCPDFLVSIDEL